MDEAELTEKVQSLLLSLDGGWHDGIELWTSVGPGGIGSTSCSVILKVSNVDDIEETYIVEARLVEDE